MFSSHHKFFDMNRMSPYDDLESILYLLCYCLYGFELPWLNDFMHQTEGSNEFYNKRLANRE